MIYALVICLLMVVAGAAFVGWLLRWNAVGGEALVDPREFARRDTGIGASS